MVDRSPSSDLIADFHLHSHHSDGRLDPSTLIDRVAGAGVQIAALTDHDTTAGNDLAARRAKERGIRFVPGVEMTTFGHGRVIHLLALGVDDDNENLTRANQIAGEVWSANQRTWLDALASAGEDVNLERDFPDRPVRLPVLVERLCRRGVDGGDPVRVHARFRSFFDALPSGAYERLASPAQAAALARAAGGVALLAHPYSLFKDGVISALLDECDGLEAVYPSYTGDQQSELRSLAQKYDKLYSCGSDYHGYFTDEYRRPQWEAPIALLRRFGVTL